MSSLEESVDNVQDRKGLWYGGLIIAIGILANFASWTFFYSYGVFIQPLSEELGSSRAEASIPPMIFLIVLSLTSPYIGALLDRFPIRRVMILFTLLMSTGLILLSRVQSQWQFYCVIALTIGLSVQGMGTISVSKLLTNWFIQHRGFALGLSTIGLSAAGMTMPLISVWLISTVGWKTSYLIFGLTIPILLIPFVARFVFNRPEDVGLSCDFNQHKAEARQSHETDGAILSGKQILQNTTFWKITFIIGIPAGVAVAMITHIVPYVTDYGISAEKAAMVLSLIAGVAMFAKPAWGWFVDQVESRVAVFLSQIVQVIGIVTFHYGDSFLIFCLAAVIYGLGMAAIPPFQGVLVARAFGRATFGKVLGCTVAATLPFTVGFIYLAASIYDAFKSYDLAFYAFTGLYGVTMVIASQLKIQRGS